MPRENVNQQKNLGKVFCENTSSNEYNKGFNSLDILDAEKLARTKCRDLQTQIFIMSCIGQIFQLSYFDLKAYIV
jgi:hypothetical protein